MSNAEDLQFTGTDLIAQRASMMSRAKILGFVPHSKQLDFIAHDSVKRKALIGGNQGGKTTLIVNEAACHAWGCRPYLPQDHPNYRVMMPNGKPIRVPNVGMIAGEDFPVGIGENLWPTFQEWLPPDAYRVAKHERSVPRIIDFDISWCPWADKSDPMYPNARVYVHAYQQGRAAFQGIRVDWILSDEPPPEDVYEEMMRGLIRSGGKWMGAMTIADQTRTWIYDLFMPPKRRTGSSQKIDSRLGSEFRSSSYYMVPLSTWDNVKQANGAGGLEGHDIQEFADGFDDPDKVQVRVHGKPLHLMGTEYGRYWDPEIHVVDERKRDPESCYVCCCDAHPTKPFAIIWYEVNAHDEWHIWAESYEERLDTITSIADHMKEVEGWRKNPDGSWIPNSGKWTPQIRFIDPLADTKEKGTGMTNIQDFSINHGIHWAKWKRGALNARIRIVKDWLKEGKGPNAKPVLTISEACPEIAFQMPRFREKMPRQASEQPRTGMFIDVDADLVQCVIAAANCGLNYQMLQQMKEPVTMSGAKETYRKTDERVSSTAGYHGNWGDKKSKDDEIVLSWGNR